MANQNNISPDISAKTTAVEPNHPHPDIIQGMTAGQYVKIAQELQESQYKKKGPPKWVRWIGDGALSVFPINRFASSIGLTSGLFLGGTLAKTLTGTDFAGVVLDKKVAPTFLQKIHGIIKYDPKALDSKNKWIGYGMWGLFSAGGFVGLKLGTWYAYKDQYTRNKNPVYLEDYLARVSQHQGDFWSWLSSFGGIFGSASGNFLTPVPGFNYGASLAFRATSMKDENLMLPGLGSKLSGSSSTLKYGVREGLDVLCRYAVNNPAKTPTDLEYYAYTILGQSFGNQLKPEHIQRFADEVHKVRDQYWQEGGIPKSKRPEALKAMQKRFTKEGLETLVEDIGLDPMKIDFLSLKGLIGKMSNTIATKKAVMGEQNEFRAKLGARRQERAKASPQAATNTEENVITVAEPSLKIFATEALKKNAAAYTTTASHQERASSSPETVERGA